MTTRQPATCQPAKTRRGFTLVELLVVITIIGLLAALILPAAQMAVEAARRTQCANNQKQISQAIASYQTSKNKYPPSFGAPTMNLSAIAGAQAEDYPWPWTALLLPEMGQQNIYDQLVSAGADMDPATNPVSGTIYQDILVCPTNPAIDTNLSYTNYCVNMGRLDNVVAANQLTDIRANGIFHDRFRRRFGPATPSPANRKVEDCDAAYLSKHDGTSQTILLGENLDATYWSVARGNSSNLQPPNETDSGLLWDLAFDANGDVDLSNAANFATGWMISPTPEEQPVPFSLAPAFARPSSFHPGVVVITMADGRQMNMNTGIQLWVYASLMTPNGRESYPQQNSIVGPALLPPVRQTDLEP